MPLSCLVYSTPSIRPVLAYRPTLWETSIVVPVPKKSRPASPNDFRPVALTSHVMKSFEKNNQNHDHDPNLSVFLYFFTPVFIF